MNPRTIVEPLFREAPRVHDDDPAAVAVEAMLETDLRAISGSWLPRAS